MAGGVALNCVANGRLQREAGFEEIFVPSAPGDAGGAIGAPLLLFRRTRVYAAIAYAGFHLSNHFLFEIGIFPWLTMAGTMMFFDPDWPRQVWRRMWGGIGRMATAAEKTADV